ncbi:MAG: iron dependent repressor, metal binding and dimerization domain protein [Chloroflexota bacterium]|nr:iron dependent repressor, metal binding and dimerization domain protein [Chloroflexota bacterium]
MVNPLYALLIAAAFTALGIYIFSPERGLFWQWQRTREMTARVLREDALKHIYHCETHAEKASVESLAGTLSISTNQVAEVIDGLQSLDLLEMAGTDFKLPAAGRDYALRIIRAHRLYERYLAEETGYEEVEWHGKAHQLEHHLSPEDVNTLAQKLGNPTHDPHGDPIPTADGKMIYAKERIALANLALDARARIVHLEDEPEAIYAQLVAEGLHIGQEIRLLEVAPQRIRFETGEGEHLLAPIFAANIAVIPIVKEPEKDLVAGLPLSNLEIGEEREVLSLSPRIRGAERRRMMDLGILPGTVISAEMESAGGDPIAYRVRGAIIALRKNQAALINVSAEA